MCNLHASKKNFPGVFRKAVALRGSGETKTNVNVEFLLSDWSFPIPTTHSYARRAFVTKSLFQQTSTAQPKILTRIGVLQEVPLLLSQSTGCNATKTPGTKIHAWK